MTPLAVMMRRFKQEAMADAKTLKRGSKARAQVVSFAKHWRDRQFHFTKIGM